MTELLGLLTTGGLSGIAGLIGGVTNRFIDYRVAKIKNQFAMRKLELDHAEAKFEAENQLKMQSLENEAQREADMVAADVEKGRQASSDMQATLASDRATYSTERMPWWDLRVIADFFRATVRIFVLYFLIYMCWKITSQLGALDLAEVISKEDAYQIIKYVIHMVFGITWMAAGFYYANRAPNPSRQT